MTSKDALDNLHRCALCHEPTTCTKDEWLKHCRDKRDIVERDLDRLEELERALDILKWLVITAEKDYDDLYTLGNLTIKEGLYDFLKKVCKG